MLVATKEMSTDHSKTFNIYTTTGETKPGLKRSFLVVQYIYAEELAYGCITLNSDMTVWPVYVEAAIERILKKQDKVKCIISFQLFEDGERFAVARRYRDPMRIVKTVEESHIEDKE